MVRTIGFPGRYTQGPDAILALPALLAELGCRRSVVLADAVVRDAVWLPLESSMALLALETTVLDFPGECTQAAIDGLSAHAVERAADCVIAWGGGKTIDTAKGVALSCGARLVVIPTIASNDSPTSRLIVLYDDHHAVAGVRLMARNPDAVIVDTTIIARAPARFFAAGLGDALSKKDEVTQCHLAGGNNFFATPSLPVARLLAEQCYADILAFGEQALHQVRDHRTPNDAVERAVQASVLLSGLAFESGGLSIAHALTRGFSAHPVLGALLHGEIVAFGALVQRFVQQDAPSAIAQQAGLTRRLGLPVCFADLGVPTLRADEIDAIAALTCQAPYIGNVVPRADRASIAAAIVATDALGRALAPSGEVGITS